MRPIPVTKQLPPAYSKVLIWSRWFKPKWRIGYFNPKHGWSLDDTMPIVFSSSVDVEYWMPLPDDPSNQDKEVIFPDIV